MFGLGVLEHVALEGVGLGALGKRADPDFWSVLVMAQEDLGKSRRCQDENDELNREM